MPEMMERETVTGCVYKDWVCCPKCQHIYFTSVDTVVDWRMTHIPIDFFERVGNCPNCGNTGLDSEKDSCRPIGRHSALRFRGKVHLPKGLTHISPGEVVVKGETVNQMRELLSDLLRKRDLDTDETAYRMTEILANLPAYLTGEGEA